MGYEDAVRNATQLVESSLPGTEVGILVEDLSAILDVLDSAFERILDIKRESTKLEEQFDDFKEALGDAL